MNRSIEILTILLVVGCGQPEPHVDTKFVPILQDYRSMCESSEYCIELPADWNVSMYEVESELPRNAIGTCRNGSVYIGANLGLNYWEFQSLVWHELAHCIHGIRHSDVSAIMNSEIVSLDTSADWQQAVNEFVEIQMRNKYLENR